MTQHILQTLGGLGMFLLAMLVMTEGLRGLAGDSLHAWLTLFTRSPGTGAVTGTVVTGVLQSSSATIVATVGFVAAGLLTFPQSLGIVLGANVGTTITGWLVAIFGFKLKLSAAAMPLILAGMLLRIFGRGRLGEAGKAVAGFGLILIGISLMQAGMSGLEGKVTSSTFPPDTLTGRLLLVGIGIIVTLVTQSSSAGVAMAMTALSVGAINFPQAAAMVIGMDVGTTVTAVIAAIGSSEAARRTGFSHTIYNLFTAVAALLLLSPYIWLLDSALPNLVNDSPVFALVGFHTLFNVFALVIVLPLAGPFAWLMEKLVPEKDTGLARRLDNRLLAEPQAAHAALEATLREEFDYMLCGVEQKLKDYTFPLDPPSQQVRQDLRDTRDFLDAMNRIQPAASQHGGPSGDMVGVRQQITTAIHALDHLRRMLNRLQQRDSIFTLRNEARFVPLTREMRAFCGQLRTTLPEGINQGLYSECLELAQRLRLDAEQARDRTIAMAVKQEISVAQSGQWLAAYRWLDRMAHHVWRVSAHLGGYDAGEVAENSADEIVEKLQ
jgi:phosphate:Na+ symporter